MPVTYEWLIPGRVMGLRWVGVVTEAELLEMDREFVRIMDNTPLPLIHFISHELDLESEPPFTAYLRAQCVRHQKFGWYLIIQKQQNIAARLVAQMAGTMLRLRLRIVEDEDSAWTYLRRMYPEFEPRPIHKAQNIQP
jgi:hypothetical protein